MSATVQLEQLRSALAGRYTVERVLGRGGMATVYAAEDLRHRRRVAVKVLDPELGAELGAERFLREIEVTAGLHHPHILPLHDSGEAALDGGGRQPGGRLLYYVMPLVEGESLRQRLARERQLPVGEAVRIACDVASALDYAHRRGIVHRDLKPENVLLQDGEALVADFGIARAISRAAEAETLTRTGVTVGTPPYMSPEQAAGERELDARTDIYSLGCVLYEMLAGIPPFIAPTAQGVIAKVLAEAPRPISAERGAVPAHVGAAVMRALEKLPADRFATAAQFAAALSAPTAGARPPGTSSAALARTPPRRAIRPMRRDAAWAALGVALGAALTALAIGAARRGDGTERAASPVGLTLAIPESQRLAGTVAISPDGRRVAYVGEAGRGRQMLYLRPLDQLGARPIPGTEGGFSPVFSPDGRWIAFRDETWLKKVPADGGSVIPIAEMPGVAAVAWGPGDVIVASSGRGLLRVSAGGGTPERLTTVDPGRGEQAHITPLFLPDGRTVVFGVVLGGAVDADQLRLVPVDAPPAGDGRAATYPTLNVAGHPFGFVDGMLIVNRRDGTVVAVPVDLRDGRVTGEPVQLLDQVRVASLSRDGAFVYVRGTDRSRLVLVDARGVETSGSDEARHYQYPRASPDGRRIAVEIGAEVGAGTDIWVQDLASGVTSRLTSRAWSTRPDWTPDGKRIAYIAEGGGRPAEAWWVPSDGSGPEERLHAMPDSLNIREVTFSPDGRFAVFRAGGRVAANDLWLLPLGGEAASGSGKRQPKLLMETPFNELMPRVSPDGRWIAYMSNESGRYEVYVSPFPGPGGKLKVSEGGGTEPVWAGPGLRLVYRTGARFVAATLAARAGTAAAPPSISVADRRELFAGRYVAAVPVRARPQYDAHPDGKRFVVLKPTADDREVVVVLNWLTEVRERVAAARTRK